MRTPPRRGSTLFARPSVLTRSSLLRPPARPPRPPGPSTLTRTSRLSGTSILTGAVARGDTSQVRGRAAQAGAELLAQGRRETAQAAERAGAQARERLAAQERGLRNTAQRSSAGARRQARQGRSPGAGPGRPGPTLDQPRGTGPAGQTRQPPGDVADQAYRRVPRLERQVAAGQQTYASAEQLRQRYADSRRARRAAALASLLVPAGILLLFLLLIGL